MTTSNTNAPELKKETTPASPLKTFFDRDDVKEKFRSMMGNRSNAFLSSVLSLVSQNEKLKDANPQSIFMCAMMAATLDLPVNQNLGFAYIIPYNDHNKGQVAQFQIGYKGLIQLALRSGQFKTISVTPVYEGQLIEEDPLKGFIFDWTKKKSETITGYAAYFSLLNGFEKTLYMTKDKVEAHGKRFSKSYAFGPWKSDFDTMAQKTVLKMLISRYAPMSVEMQKAVIADQGIINDADTLDITYEDQGAAQITKEMLSELFEMKKKALTKEEVANCERVISTEEVASYVKIHELLKSK